MLTKKQISGEIKIREHNHIYPKRGTLNCSKAKDMLGYNPTIDIEEGIKKYIDSVNLNS